MRSQIERLSINTLMPASKHFLYQNIVLGKTSAFPKSATDVSGPRFHPRHKGRAAQGKHKVWCCRGSDDKACRHKQGSKERPRLLCSLVLMKEKSW